MRDHQHGGFLFPPDRQQFLLQLLLGDRIEGAERFIEHQHRWIHRQRPGDRHPLLHASRDLAGSLIGGVAQVDHLQVMVHHPAACRWVELGPCCLDSEFHVLAHALPGQQGIVLEHHHPVRSRAFDRLTSQKHLASAGPQKARNHVEQGAFAAAGVADHTKEFPLVHLQIDVPQGLIAAPPGLEDLADLLELQEAGVFRRSGGIQKWAGHRRLGTGTTDGGKLTLARGGWVASGRERR